MDWKRKVTAFRERNRDWQDRGAAFIERYKELFWIVPLWFLLLCFLWSIPER